jgi:hypothetical protein
MTKDGISPKECIPFLGSGDCKGGSPIIEFESVSDYN